MKMKKSLKKAIFEHHGGEKLFKTDVYDIHQHGIASGFSSWTYYKDILPFFIKYKKDILETVAEISDELDIPMQKLLKLESQKNLIELTQIKTVENFKHLDSNIRDGAIKATWTVVEALADEIIMEMEKER